MIGRTRRYRDGGEEPKAGYSRGVRRAGHIAVSGTTASGPDTYTQTVAALQQAFRAIDELGGSMDDVVRTRIYLAPAADWEAAARAHSEVMGAQAPANTMLHVASLIGAEFLVEVEMEAVID